GQDSGGDGHLRRNAELDQERRDRGDDRAEAVHDGLLWGEGARRSAPLQAAVAGHELGGRHDGSVPRVYRHRRDADRQEQRRFLHFGTERGEFRETVAADGSWTPPTRSSGHISKRWNP